MMTFEFVGIGRAICKALHGSGAKVYGVSKTHCNLLSLQVGVNGAYETFCLVEWGAGGNSIYNNQPIMIKCRGQW